MATPEMSTPTTLPAVAVLDASRVDPPVPQPTSRTRSRGPTPLAARNRSSCARASASKTCANLTRWSVWRRIAGTTTSHVDRGGAWCPTPSSRSSSAPGDLAGQRLPVPGREEWVLGAVDDERRRPHLTEPGPHVVGAL